MTHAHGSKIHPAARLTPRHAKPRGVPRVTPGSAPGAVPDANVGALPGPASADVGALPSAPAPDSTSDTKE